MQFLLASLILLGSSYGLHDRARISPTSRIVTSIYEEHKSLEDLLNNQLFKVLRSHNVTFFTLKTNEGSLRATVDPQSTWFILEENERESAKRERISHYHNDDLQIVVSSEFRQPASKIAFKKIEYSPFEEVKPGVIRYWARVLPEEHVPINRRKFARLPTTV